jgi:uronate dehydrogenase
VTRPTVVITGASGVVGTILRHGLAREFDVRGVDRRAPGDTGGPPVRRANLVHPGSARRALAGADVVVALAGNPSTRATWSDLRRRDLRIVWNTLQAARVNGTRRVILASSNHVSAGYERDHPYRDIVAGEYGQLSPGDVPRITVDMAVRPTTAYGVGKVAAEAAGRQVAETDGPSVISLRLGTVRRTDRPEEPRHYATLLTHRDLVALVERSIDAPPDLRFGTFYGVSGNTWNFWDIADAHRRLGYVPADDAEAWR